MKIAKLILTIALIACVSVLSAQINPVKIVGGPIDTVSSITNVAAGNIQTNAGNGFLTVTSASKSVPADSAVTVGTLPAGTKQIAFYVHAGTGVNYGPAGVASGTSYPEVASATLSPWFEVATSTPSIYLIGNSGAATATILAR